MSGTVEYLRRGRNESPKSDSGGKEERVTTGYISW